MIRDRRFAARLLWAGALVVLLLHTARVALAVRSHGSLIGDDIVGFWLARTLPWPKFLATPIDVHVVPLHRLASLAIYRLAPMSFDAGLVVLLGLHGLTVFVLYRVLSELVGHAAAAVASCVYGMHPCVGGLLVWWTSGLHRLGCVFCVVSTLYAYVRWRSSGRRSWLAAVAGFAAASVGFYCKGVLVPLYVIGLDASLRACRCPSPSVRKAVVPVAIVCVIAGAYVVAWRLVAEPAVRGINVDPRFVATFVKEGLWFLFPSVLGVWLGQGWVYPLAFGVFFVVFAVTLWGARRSALAWVSLAVALAANMALIALSSAKVGLFGYAALLCDRYYFENVFLVILFAAIAARPALQRISVAPLLSPPAVRFGVAGVLLLGLVALSQLSTRSFETIRVSNYSSSERARTYMQNLRESVASLPEGQKTPLVLRDSPVSKDLVPLGDLVTRNSALLLLMGESVRVSPKAHYAVGSDGTVVRRSRRKR